MAVVLTQRDFEPNRDTEKTQGKRPCDNGGKDQGDPVISQETPRTASNPEKLGHRHEEDSP